MSTSALDNLCIRAGTMDALASTETIVKDDSVTLAGTVSVAGTEVRKLHDFHHLVGGYALLGTQPEAVIALFKDHAVGSQLHFSTTLPPSFTPTEAAGKQAEVAVTIQGAQRQRPAVADDELGIAVEAHHHEVATAGQCEIDMRFEELLKMGDQMMWYKYIIKNVARRNGKTVTFMPKPIFEDNGSGMHTHISLWKGKNTLMAGDGYAGLSEMALHGIGGILKHGRAILAFAAPTANSYHRLVPGFEAPVTLALSQRNRSAAVRIPMYSASPKAKRAEFRCPDPSCNPYLTFTALMMAMIDGIQNKIDPGQPLDRDIYDMTPEELAETNQTPGSLPEALEALQKDHAFLTKGDVFTNDLIETWIEWKLEKEVDPIRLRPHPYEFELYYNA